MRVPNARASRSARAITAAGSETPGVGVRKRASYPAGGPAGKPDAGLPRRPAAYRGRAPTAAPSESSAAPKRAQSPRWSAWRITS